ncbi:hypothetical protein [Haladaptatus pallidirubidus]
MVQSRTTTMVRFVQIAFISLHDVCSERALVNREGTDQCLDIGVV